MQMGDQKQTGLEDRQKTKKQMRICVSSRKPKTPRKTFYRVQLMMGWWMAEIHKPARKPPRWPQQSMLPPSEEEGVKMKMKTMIISAVHQIWHFMAGPIRSSPFQFITMYPIINPIIPNSAVDAPAFTPEGLQSMLKMFPQMPQTKQMIRVLTHPKVYSMRERNMKVVMRLPKMCMKQMCRNMAEIRRQTYPFRTNGWQLPPQSIKVCTFTCSKLFEPLFRPTDTSKMKRAMSARLIRKVSDKNLKVGHRAYVNMSQQFQSCGFFTCLRPETNRILCSSAILSCSASTGSEKPSRKPLS